MDMEGVGTEELVAGSCDNDATHISAKGKRTKRPRPSSPCAVAAATAAMTSSCSSASSGGDYGGSFSSTTTTTSEGTEQEEEDMANCLILLAQGRGGGEDAHHRRRRHHKQQGEDVDRGDGNNNKMTEKGSSGTSSRRFAEMATATATTKIGFYIYECKTCNRTFSSFQALGGHRASHKKPKPTPEEKKPPPPPPGPPVPLFAAPPPPPSPPPITNCEFEEAKQTHIKISPPVSFQLGCGNNRSSFHGNKPKIHECSICGSEFTSGQALGGHMRRHRASANTRPQVVGIMNSIETSCDSASAAAAVDVKPRNVLELDLNLPAPPEDDLRDSKFQFTATQKSMVLSAAPTLVGCHY